MKTTKTSQFVRKDSAERRKPASETIFYLATNGNDAWTGRHPAPTADGADGPFATPFRACVAVSTSRAADPGRRVRVVIRGGYYFLDAALTVTPDHSGTATAPVIFCAYPGEAPVLSGGRRIGSWQAGTINGHPCWVAELPDVRAGKWFFTQLFVDGVRRLRSRLPRSGYYRFSGIPDGASASKASTAWMEGPECACYMSGDMQAWHNLEDVKVLAFQFWFEMHHRIRALDPLNHIVHFRAPSLGNLRDDPNTMARYCLENVMEAVCEPGDWYLDRPAGKLYYIPLPGQTMTATEVIAPCSERLLLLAGTDAAPVAHVHFENLSFEHAEWDYAPDDPGSVQAAFKVPGAVVIDRAEHCVFYGCSISKVAHYGIEVKAGSHANRIVACSLFDLGAGGVRINHERLDRVDATSGAVEPGSAASRPSETTVSDCEIHDGSLLYPSAVGIWIGNSGRNRILHNHVFNFNYTGISCGWTWGYAPSATVDNRIEYNHVHHIALRQILCDNGGIYTLGIQPGTILRGNHIHDIGSYNSVGGLGIYLDEGSSEMRVEDNIVHHTLHGSLCTNYGRDNVVRNNIFALAEDGQVYAGLREDHRTVIFERNILYWKGAGWRRQDDVAAGFYTFRRNVQWKAGGGALDLGGGTTVADWQKLGQHLDTLVADPLFADPDAGNFALRADSPALKIGFKPLDPALAGPRCPDKRPVSFADWQADPPPDCEIVRTFLRLVKPNQLEVTVENVGPLPASGSMRLATAPAGQVKLPCASEFAFKGLAPGVRKSELIPIEIAADVTSLFVETVPKGECLVPALLYSRRRPLWRMLRLPTRPDAAQTAAVLAGAGVVPWRLQWCQAAEAVAEVRAALFDNALAIHARVKDRQVEQDQQPWLASCIEVFSAPDDGFGAVSKSAVAQIFLIPGTGAAPAHAKRQHQGRTVDAPEIQVVCTTTVDGYDMQAIVPLDLLNLLTDVRTFRLEVVVNARARPGGIVMRTALHDAPKAYANADGYGSVVVVTPPAKTTAV